MAPSVTTENGGYRGGRAGGGDRSQAAGLPSSGHSLRHSSIVVHNKTGLLCAERDIDALTNNLALLVSDPERMEKFGNAARIRAREHFSIQRQVKDINEIYRSLV